MKRSQQTVEAEGGWEWSMGLHIVVFAFALPILVLEFQNLVSVTIASLGPGTLRGSLYRTNEWLVVLPIAMVGYCVARRGLEAAYLAVMGLAASVYIQMTFRSVRVRPGTFDLFEESYWKWVAPLMAALFVGIVAAAMVNHARGRIATAPRKVWLLPLGLILLSGEVARETLLLKVGSVSEFAPTMHWVLALLAITSLALWAVGTRMEAEGHDSSSSCGYAA